tara:strand:+ start:772 stop:1407 length:636 start_codon:yes stop_codon:yes gene_type:complete
MSWSALDWASKQITGNGTNKLVLLSLSNYADDNNTCFPSFKTLVKITELSRSTIIRSLKDLENKGFINIKERFADINLSKRQTSNLYTLHIGYQIDTTQYQNETPPSISTKPQLTSNNKPMYSKEFDLFWKLYPDRPNDNKFGAFQKYNNILKNKEIGYNELIEKTKMFARSQEGKDSKFIPHAKTWLNQKRYLDVKKDINKKPNLNLLVG